ncbi:MAG: ABC transporter permease [Planctomycetes bacterium]|nr:ABC transporter permease [Planctomycetota bacterium]
MNRVKSVFSNYTTIIAFIMMLIIAGLASNKFYTPANVAYVMRQAAPLGIVALGVLFVIITGGIDLSVGAIIALGNVVLALMALNHSITVSILAALAACSLVGLISGLLVTKGRITPFVATLAMMTILRGLTLILTKGNPIFIEDESFLQVGTGTFFRIPYPFIILIAFFIISSILLGYTIFGRVVVAIGSNEMAAKYAALNVHLFKTLAYIFCGFSAGVAAVILSARTGVGSALVADGYELDAIAAVVIGGASLSGGKGRTFNTLLGALIISMISNIMNLAGVPGYHQNIVKGLIIICAVLAESVKSRKQ